MLTFATAVEASAASPAKETMTAIATGRPRAVIHEPALGLMLSGDTLELDALSPGTHMFECLIHPWMRTVVDQD